MHSVFIMNKTKELQNYIESFDTIAVFRHVNPDGDALGSQLGLVKWIRHNYPEKTVYALGSDDHNYEIYDAMDQVDELENFLAIVVDTANRPRVDDDRYQYGDKIIKIDHHLIVDEYGDLQIVDIDRGSACEIVTDLLREMDKSFTPEISKMLLSGILTDTLRFSIEKTSGKTLDSAAYLVSQGANISMIQQELFTQPRFIFELKAKLMSHVKVKNNLAYLFLDAEELNSLGVSWKDVKAQVNMMANVDEFHIWVVITENTDENFEVSIRSRRNTINDIAESYGGGGHRLASGVSGLTRDQALSVIEDLAKRSLEDYTA